MQLDFERAGYLTYLLNNLKLAAGRKVAIVFLGKGTAMWSHGSFYWNELMTRDAEAAKKFYGDTIGWTFDAMPMPDGTYWVAKMGGTPVGGIFTMNGPAFEGLQEHWVSYIAVDDVNARLKKLTAAGGKVHRDPFDIPNVGRIAIVEDPGGAVMAWMTPTGQ
jgi:predicted enzyme related to lactoylglutathione lyase